MLRAALETGDLASGGRRRRWSADTACGGWPDVDPGGGFLSRGTVESRFRQMAAWFHLNCKWRGSCGGILHSVCRALGGKLNLRAFFRDKFVKDGQSRDVTGG
jgi:hypothetical protein